jgi:hypothetical protein
VISRSGEARVDPAHEGVEVGVGGARLAEMRMQGVAGGIEGVVVLLQRLFGGRALADPVRAAAGGASTWANRGGLFILVGAVFRDGMDAARGDVEAAGAIRAKGKQAGDSLDAGTDGVIGFERERGETLAGEGSGEGGDVLWLVGSTVPAADVVAAGEIENGGKHNLLRPARRW